MKRVVVTVDVPDQAVAAYRLQPAAAVSATDHVRNFLEFLKNAVLEGTLSAVFTTKVTDTAGVKNVWTITCTRANAGTDTVTVAGVALVEATDFARGATDITCGTALAAAILSNALLVGLFESADVDAGTGTITLTSAGYGQAGALTTSDATAFGITHTTEGVAETVVTSTVTSTVR